MSPEETQRNLGSPVCRTLPSAMQCGAHLPALPAVGNTKKCKTEALFLKSLLFNETRPTNGATLHPRTILVFTYCSCIISTSFPSKSTQVWMIDCPFTLHLYEIVKNSSQWSWWEKPVSGDWVVVLTQPLIWGDFGQVPSVLWASAENEGLEPESSLIY